MLNIYILAWGWLNFGSLKMLPVFIIPTEPHAVPGSWWWALSTYFYMLIKIVIRFKVFVTWETKSSCYRTWKSFIVQIIGGDWASSFSFLKTCSFSNIFLAYRSWPRKIKQSFQVLAQAETFLSCSFPKDWLV